MHVSVASTSVCICVCVCMPCAHSRLLGEVLLICVSTMLPVWWRCALPHSCNEVCLCPNAVWCWTAPRRGGGEITARKEYLEQLRDMYDEIMDSQMAELEEEEAQLVEQTPSAMTLRRSGSSLSMGSTLSAEAPRVEQPVEQRSSPQSGTPKGGATASSMERQRSLQRLLSLTGSSLGDADSDEEEKVSPRGAAKGGKKMNVRQRLEARRAEQELPRELPPQTQPLEQKQEDDGNLQQAEEPQVGEEKGESPNGQQQQEVEESVEVKPLPLQREDLSGPAGVENATAVLPVESPGTPTEGNVARKGSDAAVPEDGQQSQVLDLLQREAELARREGELRKREDDWQRQELERKREELKRKEEELQQKEEELRSREKTSKPTEGKGESDGEHLSRGDRSPRSSMQTGGHRSPSPSPSPRRTRSSGAHRKQLSTPKSSHLFSLEERLQKAREELGSMLVPAAVVVETPIPETERLGSSTSAPSVHNAVLPSTAHEMDEVEKNRKLREELRSSLREKAVLFGASSSTPMQVLPGVGWVSAPTTPHLQHSTSLSAGSGTLEDDIHRGGSSFQHSRRFSASKTDSACKYLMLKTVSIPQ